MPAIKNKTKKRKNISFGKKVLSNRMAKTNRQKNIPTIVFCCEAGGSSGVIARSLQRELEKKGIKKFRIKNAGLYNESADRILSQADLVVSPVSLKALMKNKSIPEKIKKILRKKKLIEENISVLTDTGKINRQFLEKAEKKLKEKNLN